MKSAPFWFQKVKNHSRSTGRDLMAASSINTSRAWPPHPATECYPSLSPRNNKGPSMETPQRVRLSADRAPRENRLQNVHHDDASYGRRGFRVAHSTVRHLDAPHRRRSFFDCGNHNMAFVNYFTMPKKFNFFMIPVSLLLLFPKGKNHHYETPKKKADNQFPKVNSIIRS